MKLAPKCRVLSLPSHRSFWSLDTVARGATPGWARAGAAASSATRPASRAGDRRRLSRCRPPASAIIGPTLSTPGPQVSIVIPCLDEEQTIPRLCAALDSTLATLQASGRSVEVVVVDDGSEDSSFALLREAAATRPWLRLV